MRTIGFALLLSLHAGFAAQAQPQPQLPDAHQPATLGAEARPILAWTDFCQRYAAECAVNAQEPARITLTGKVWTQIITINRRVNRSIELKIDQQHWGVPDRWDLAEDGTGDCEDLQLLKRRLLAQAGLPRRAMRVTVVIDEKGEGHAVLTILTDRGDFVLDNKTSAVTAWHETGYIFIKRESTERLGWVSLGGATQPVAKAVPN